NSQRPAMDFPPGRCASSTRPSASTTATATTRMTGSSAPVAAIDVDVAMGEVAGPDRGAALADTDIDGDLQVPPFHILGDGRLLIARPRPALSGDLGAAHRDLQAVAIRLLAAFPHGHDDAAPIGVAGGERRLHQG